jgi:hypothetical protein
LSQSGGTISRTVSSAVIGKKNLKALLAFSQNRNHFLLYAFSLNSLFSRCHDIDLILHLMNPLKPTKVSSFGSLAHFKKDKKPIGAGSSTKKCMQCPLKSSCAYSAKTIYLDPVTSSTPPVLGWPVSVLLEGRETELERIMKNPESDPKTIVRDIEGLVERALDETAYGNCVYESENDVCDNQVTKYEHLFFVSLHFSV